MNTYTTDLTKAGGDDEFQGNTIYTFTRPDGTDLGCQAECGWLQAYAPGFRDLLNYLYKVRRSFGPVDSTLIPHLFSATKCPSTARKTALPAKERTT